MKSAALVGSWFHILVHDRRSLPWTVSNTSLDKRQCQSCLFPLQLLCNEGIGLHPSCFRVVDLGYISLWVKKDVYTAKSLF